MNAGQEVSILSYHVYFVSFVIPDTDQLSDIIDKIDMASLLQIRFSNL